MKIRKDKNVLKIIGYRYRGAKKGEKGKILDELCDLHGYNRKYLVQIFNFHERRKYIRRGRKTKYPKKILLLPLVRIWLATDQICSKKLKVALPQWVPFYDEELSEKIKKHLLKISAATIDRLLKPQKVKSSLIFLVMTSTVVTCFGSMATRQERAHLPGGGNSSYWWLLLHLWLQRL